LKDLERRNGSAILSPGPLFDPERARQRERAAFARLRAAVGQRLKPDLLTLEPAGPDATPALEIGYHVAPSGSLLAYTQSLAHEEDGAVRVNGLLRGYEIEWVIKARPHGSDKVLEHKLTSRAPTSAKVRVEPVDPDWAPYAILLYLCFRDMEDRLSRSLDARPEPLPEPLSFQEALGR
jgi:hypothetical protein